MSMIMLTNQKYLLNNNKNHGYALFFIMHGYYSYVQSSQVKEYIFFVKNIMHIWPGKNNYKMGLNTDYFIFMLQRKYLDNTLYFQSQSRFVIFILPISQNGFCAAL